MSIDPFRVEQIVIISKYITRTLCLMADCV